MIHVPWVEKGTGRQGDRCSLEAPTIFLEALVGSEAEQGVLWGRQRLSSPGLHCDRHCELCRSRGPAQSHPNRYQPRGAVGWNTSLESLVKAWGVTGRRSPRTHTMPHCPMPQHTRTLPQCQEGTEVLPPQTNRQTTTTNDNNE